MGLLRFHTILFLLPLITLLHLQTVHGMIEGLYCGNENCYDVLGITRDSSKSEIGKAYRSLARKHHPDKHQSSEAKAEAEKKFQLLATAYEILKDDGSKADYDYMLDNPEEFYEHYYRYYKRRLAPQIDIRLVIAVTISVISAIQFYTSWYRYDLAIKYLVTVPKYRIQALDIAKREGIPLGSKDKKKKERKNVSKDDLKREEDEAIRKIIEEKMDIRGGYAKPTWKDVLIVQLVLLPYTIGQWIKFQLSWLWRFTYKGEPLGDAEKLYLIRRYMGKSASEFEALDPKDHEAYIREELYVWDNFKAWKEEVEEEERRALAENARYKSFRRYMKNHGPGRITFDDD